MANEEQLAILKQGVDVWNKWREENRKVEIDLSNTDFSMAPHFYTANFSKANLKGAIFGRIDFRRASFYEADLSDSYLELANLDEADFRHANLTNSYMNRARLREANFGCANLTNAVLSRAILLKSNFFRADLIGTNLAKSALPGADFANANLTGANLRGSNLFRANFAEANLTGANLSGASLIYANLVEAKIDEAVISKSSIYGVNVWDLKGEFKEQKDLIITSDGDTKITVDNIEVAQFVFLILNNKKIRGVLDILTSKAVLILGRFADDKRKTILNALRNKLREYNLLPIVFDFDRPIDRNITETVKTLAGISFFVIADITSPKSSPLELQAIVPDYQIPVVPIIQDDDELPFSMINDLKTQHDGLLDPLFYDTEETLMKVLKSAIIDPAIERHNELRLVKAQNPKIRSAKDFLEKGELP